MDYIGPAPRNKMLGLLADVMTYGKEKANNVTIPKVIPLLGGEGLGNVLIGDADKEVNDWSYGHSPVRINPNAGRTASFVPEIVPGRKQQLADAVMLFGPTKAGRGAAATAAGMVDTGASKAINPLMARELRIGDLGFDPRFDDRVLEQGRLHNLTTKVQERPMQAAPKLNLADYEGRPFITSMSDRTAAGGSLTNINGVELNRPVNLRGGQDYMFDNNPGQVWASAREPVKAIMDVASQVKAKTGKDPLYMPWRMAPTGGDFAAMTGETMLNFADANMSKTTKAALDRKIKKFIPEWEGVSSEKAIEQFRSAPDSRRKAVKNMMDTDFRDRGGLNIGEARLAVTDPFQLTAKDGAVMNVGEVFSDAAPITASGHPSYPYGVPGRGIGRLDSEIGVYQLLRDAANMRGIPNPATPRTNDLRALQMKPYAGLIDEPLLRSLDNLGLLK